MRIKTIMTALVLMPTIGLASPKKYVVIDLSGGPSAGSYPISTLDDVPAGGWTDEYKMSKLVMRYIAPGTFNTGNLQHDPNYVYQNYRCWTNITLTIGFYIGVFEVTQKQYELMENKNPSRYAGEKRPVERVSYDMIRGSNLGAQWPTSASIDQDSMLYRLRQKTGIAFDLPTETQWEYACRAGTSTDYNNGRNFSSWYIDSAVDSVGRYFANHYDGHGDYSDAHTTVGSYDPNAWGLYDMHGNVHEWALDWRSTDAEYLKSNVTDPVGPTDANAVFGRVIRGGSSWSHAHHTASWMGGYNSSDGVGQGNGTPAAGNDADPYGFRMVFAAPVVDVVASPVSDTKFIDSVTVKIAASGNPTIWYTTDGSDPKTSATRASGTSVVLTETTTLKYYAATAYCDETEVKTAHYYKRLPDGGPYEEVIGEGYWTFGITNGFSSVVRTTDRCGQVTMPSRLGGCEVVSVMPSAFERCVELTGVTMPNTIGSIDDNAFRECVGLTRVSIPASVTNIGYFAFRDCLRLRTVT